MTARKTAENTYVDAGWNSRECERNCHTNSVEKKHEKKEELLKKVRLIKMSDSDWRTKDAI